MDYYNDWQNMVRSNCIEYVIDRYHEWLGRDCRTPSQRRAHDDVADVLSAIYAAVPASYPALIRLARICAQLTPREFALLCHILRGGNFSDFAIGEGVTGAAVGQWWHAVVSRLPMLEKVK